MTHLTNLQFFSANVKWCTGLLLWTRLFIIRIGSFGSRKLELCQVLMMSNLQRLISVISTKSSLLWGTPPGGDLHHNNFWEIRVC